MKRKCEEKRNFKKIVWRKNNEMLVETELCETNKMNSSTYKTFR